ncbi:AI-2E family transporter [Actinomadura macrotermitis]|uniref:Putative transport protein YhhT n=1 Tax=Actinomadura macrotermitis TaxID=2585200 RepID=A0A7K0BSA1_9ACTN|nr:AI-2E family transporter [Actinomadura macrotermitis]MQY04078.1 putative transport protein YhhT [Actinomadura macrotermitis]
MAHDAGGGRAAYPPLAYYAKVTLVVLAVLAGVALFWTARSVWVAVFMGLFLAVGLDPMVRRIQRVVPRRGLAVLVLLLALLVVIGALLYIVLRPAVAELTQLANALPGLVDRLTSPKDPVGSYLNRPEVRDSVQKFLKRLPALVTGSAKPVLGAVGSALSGLVTVGASLVLMIYFMLAWPRMVKHAERLLRDRERVEVAHESLGKIGGYVTGQLCVSVLAGVSAYAFLKIAGVPYPSLLAVVVGVCDFIPQVGATIGAVIGILVALSESIGLAVAAAVFFFVYQHVENYLIVPRVFSKTVALSPVTVFISALVGVTVAGFIGAVVALPCVAAVKVVLRYVFRDRLAALDAA